MPLAFLGIAISIFSLCMLVDCLRNGRDYYWVLVIMMTGGLGAFIYYYHFHWTGSYLERLLWAGAAERRKISELKNRIHFFKNAASHQELGDAYLSLQKLPEAAESYREALTLNPDSFEAMVGLGYTLLKLGDAEGAWKYLKPAYQKDPRYRDDELLWQCARCQAARRAYDDARELYDYFLTRHSYYEAQIEYAQLLARMGQPEKAVEQLHEIIADIENSPRYVQRREGHWKWEARRVLRTLQNGAPASAAAGAGTPSA